MIHTHFHQGCSLQIAFSSVWEPKEITVTCKRGEQETFFFPGKKKKRQRLHHFQIYYPVRRSPWDRFDVNLKAYSDTSYSNNKRGSSTQPKITRPANRILPTFLPVTRFVFTPLCKITSNCPLIDARRLIIPVGIFFFSPLAQKHRAGLAAGALGGMDSCRLSAVVWRKEYILHVARKKVRDIAVWPRHLSLRLRTSTETKGEQRRPAGRRQRPLSAIVLQVRRLAMQGPCAL